QRRLPRCGVRAGSLAADITNYVMLELGQPLHAWDRERLTGTVTVRAAEAGEKLKTLDHVQRALDTDDTVIADDTGAQAVAGVMRSEEHTSELQSRFDLVCRLLLEKKKNYSTLVIIS